MKVLCINSVCGVGSTGRICTDIADILAKNGHVCKIAYGRGGVPEKYKDNAVRIGSNLSIKIDAFKTRLFDNAGFNSKRATKKFIKWVKEFNPDVIHLHNLHGYYINLEVLFDYLKSCGKRIIWSLHDCWAFTGHCSHFDLIGCNKWQDACYNCPRRKAYPKSIFLDRSKKNYAKKKALFTGIDNLTIVTPSKWLMGKVKESFLGGYDVQIIPNGIDLTKFCPTESSFVSDNGLEGKKIVLGVASAWSVSKGAKIFSELAQTLPDDFKVVLVGMTKHQIEKFEMSDKILFIDKTNSVEQLAKIYFSATVFVNPSRQETMGLTTIEAMACGTPVVVSNCTAVPEVVTPSSGIVVLELSTDEICSAIYKVVDGTFDNVALNAKNYEKQQQYLKYLNLYIS